MNKKLLIQEIAQRSGLSQRGAQRALDAMLEVIAQTLAKGEQVKLVGFGSFEVRERGARSGLNPRTMKPVLTPACRVPVFRVGRPLRETVNREK